MTYTHTHTHTYFRPKYSESDICCFMCTHVKTCYSECVLINGEDEDWKEESPNFCPNWGLLWGYMQLILITTQKTSIVNMVPWLIFIPKVCSLSNKLCIVSHCKVLSCILDVPGGTLTILGARMSTAYTLSFEDEPVFDLQLILVKWSIFTDLHNAFVFKMF